MGGHAIHAQRVTHLIYTSEILASEAIKDFFARLRESYEYVIVVLSPIAPVVDVRSATHLVDSFLFVIQWEKQRSTSRSTLSILPAACMIISWQVCATHPRHQAGDGGHHCAAEELHLPTDAELLHAAIKGLVRLAKEHGVRLRQSYLRLAKHAAMMAGRYAHAKQFKRHRGQLRLLRISLGRIIRDVRRKIAGRPEFEATFERPLARAPTKPLPAAAPTRV